MHQVFAQSLTMPGSTISGPAGFKYATTHGALGIIISQAIPLVFAAAGIGLLLMIISSGFTLMTSAGDPKKLQTGRQRLVHAITGFVIIFAAYWIMQITGILLGIEEIQTLFGS